MAIVMPIKNSRYAGKLVPNSVSAPGKRRAGGKRRCAERELDQLLENEAEPPGRQNDGDGPLVETTDQDGLDKRAECISDEGSEHEREPKSPPQACTIARV